MNQSVQKQLFSGVFYTALAKYSGIIVSLVVAGILARLLSPDDFGIVAIATVIIAFFGIFTDMGLSPAIIQHKDLSTKELSDIFSFTIWTGILLSILFFVASWPIGHYYDSVILRQLCQFLSINLFFASANIVPNALFYKNKEFRFLAIRSLSIQFLGGTAAIIAAFMGAGLYALIINPILSSILLFIISIRYYPQQLKWTLGWTTIKRIFSYSAYQFLFNMINYFSRNLDKLLIGKYMSLAQLGYYEKSYRLMMLPLQNITQVITPVMHPVLSDYQSDKEKLASSYERIIRLLAFIGFPLSVFLFFTAKEITLIVFGNQWLASVPVFKVLALSVGTQIVLSSSGSIFQAAGDTKSLFICGLFSSILNVSAMLVGIFVFQTLVAVAWAIVIAFSINFIQCYYQMYVVTFHRKAQYLLRELISPFVLSLIIASLLVPVYYLTNSSNIFLSLIVKGIIFMTILGTYIQLTNEYNILLKLKKVIKRN